MKPKIGQVWIGKTSDHIKYIVKIHHTEKFLETTWIHFMHIEKECGSIIVKTGYSLEHFLENFTYDEKLTELEIIRDIIT